VCAQLLQGWFWPGRGVHLSVGARRQAGGGWPARRHGDSARRAGAAGRSGGARGVWALTGGSRWVCVCGQGMVACEDARASHVPSERSWRRVQVRCRVPLPAPALPLLRTTACTPAWRRCAARAAAA